MKDAGSSKWIIIGVLYVIEFTMIFFASSNSGVLAFIALICAIVGWKTVSMIQPSMFIWMPLAGWVIYFIIKFLVAYFVGLFVAPYTIGNKITEVINSK